MAFPAEKEYLIHENIGLVKRLAFDFEKKIRDNSIDVDDLKQAGFMGLMHAATHFDEENNTAKFSSYAYKCIYGYMLRLLNRVSHIYVPVNIKHVAGQITRYDLRDKELDEIIAVVKAPKYAVKRALQYLSLKTVTSDKPIKPNDEEMTLSNLFYTVDDYSGMYLDDFLKMLKPQQKKVLYGLLKGKQIREIAPTMGISYQRVGALKKEIEARYEVYRLREKRMGEW